MGKTFIFGHKKPDTDSVTSCIALSYLKNKMGKDTEPRVLGSINKETAYALETFGVEKPEYLNDVKLQMKDVSYHKGFMVEDIAPIYNGYQAMIKEGLTGIPVVDKNKQFFGLLTMKDLSRMFLNATSSALNTSYENLLQVLSAEEICKFDDEIGGELLVAAYRSTTFIQNVALDANKILIVGDRHSVIEYAVESGIKMIIIAGSGEIKEEHLEIARKNHVNVIRSSYDTYHIAKLMPLTNYIKTMVNSYNPTKFEDTDFISDVLEINDKLKHTNYPIVDKQNECLGLFKLTDLSEKSPKHVILVDHNEKAQSADGIGEAEILEIIDHHNLGSITTSAPINFRNMAVGSTCTIVYNLFLEQDIEIPKEIAGLLLSGIVSDTLILKSPTATKKDREAVLALSHLAEVDYETYGMELLKAGTSLEGMSAEDVIYNDFKVFNVGEKSFAIGQFFTMNFGDIKSEEEKYIHALDEIAEANHYDLITLYVTDIVKNGSYILYNKRAKSLLETAYNIEILEQGHYFDGCVSRKKHIVPVIMDVFE